MDRGGGRVARVVSVVLAFVLLGSLGQLAAGARSSAWAASHGPPAAAGPVDAGARSGDGRAGDTDGSPGVLPPQSRIHVLVNRGNDRPGAPSPAAAVATPLAAEHAVRAGHTAPAGPMAGDAPAAGCRWERAPPHAAA